MESSKSLEPSLQQFGTVNAMVSGSLRFDKDPVVWSAGEVPLSSHTAIITIYRQRWTQQTQYTTTCIHHRHSSHLVYFYNLQIKCDIPSSRTGSGEVARERGGEEEEGRWGEGPLGAEEDFDRTCFDFKREVTLGPRSEGEREWFINGCLYMKGSEAWPGQPKIIYWK